MWTDSIIDEFPFAQGLIDFSHVEAAVGEFVEFLGVGSLCSFHVAIQLRGTRRQHEEMDAPPLALSFKQVLEF